MKIINPKLKNALLKIGNCDYLDDLSLTSPQSLQQITQLLIEDGNDIRETIQKISVFSGEFTTIPEEDDDECYPTREIVYYEIFNSGLLIHCITTNSDEIENLFANQ